MLQQTTEILEKPEMVASRMRGVKLGLLDYCSSK